MIIEHLLDDNNLTNTEKSIAQFLLNKDQKLIILQAVSWENRVILHKRQ